MNDKFKLDVHISFNSYNKDSNHSIEILINNDSFYKQSFVINERKSIKIDKSFNFFKPGRYNIEFLWSGENESAEKHFNLENLSINYQYIEPYKLFYYPTENEYIRSLKHDNLKLAQFKKTALEHGGFFGWYGSMKTNFLVGNANEINYLRINDPFSLNNAAESRILTILDQQKLYKKVKKND